MTLQESSIFINLKLLRRRLYSAQFAMMKADRIIYGTPLMTSAGKALAAFVLAFTIEGKRVEYLEERIGHFAVLRTDLEFCVDENIFKFRKRPPKSDSTGNPIQWETPEQEVSTQKVELFRLVAQIDSDMCKWRRSLAKGQAPA